MSSIAWPCIVAASHPERAPKQNTSCTTPFAMCGRGLEQAVCFSRLETRLWWWWSSLWVGGGRVCARHARTRAQRRADVVVTLFTCMHVTRSRFRTGQSGKSTIVKQMKIIHGGGYTDREREAYRDIVHENIITAMQVGVLSSQIGLAAFVGVQFD